MSADLSRDAANFVPLSPLNFLVRAAQVYPDQVALVHGELRQTWSQTYERSRRLASALTRLGVSRGDVVAVMAPNIPALYEAHFGVPMAAATLLALNTRLDVDTTAYILEHSNTKVLFCDREFSDLLSAVLPKVTQDIVVIDLNDPVYDGVGHPLGKIDYEALLETGDPQFEMMMPADEWDNISLNYTSGTTGRPKGALYSHRATYLNAMGNMVSTGMRLQSNYLWTLPMFHCNGWCFPWTLAMIAGTNVCLRRVEPKAIFAAIKAHRVEYFCAAPVVLTMLAHAPAEHRFVPDWSVQVITGGAAPPAALIAAMGEISIEVTHMYGLTETLGPSVICAWHEKWNAQDLDQQARLKSRIGVRKHTMEDAMVVDVQTMAPVPWDGQTIGELVMRGNTVMKGYLKNPEATAQAFKGGWFHSGDLVVVHPDGYFEVKDRLKDIVISGGENISTVEVEGVLYRHPAVLEAAVVAMPHQKWGETPCAFVTLKEGAQASAQDIVDFCKEHMAGFKVPHRIVFAALPKTSTGKIQKFVLREQARELAQTPIQ
jgi:fatty-acyl-CoA synthase